MSLFKNRERSGVVLTGVVLSSGVVSAVNQGIVGAVPKSKVNGTLKNSAGKSVRSSDSVVVNFLKDNWKWVLAVFGIVIIAGIVLYNMFFNKENNIENEENIKNIEKEKFKKVFCSEEALKGEEGNVFQKKLSCFSGDIFKIDVEELRSIVNFDKLNELSKKSFASFTNSKEHVYIRIKKISSSGNVTFVFVDEKGKDIIESGNFFTKYAKSGNVVDFVKYLRKSKVEVDEGLFGNVFRSYEQPFEEAEKKEIVEKFSELEGGIFEISVEDFNELLDRDSSNVDAIREVNDFIAGKKGVDFVSIKIKFSDIVPDLGCFIFNFLGENYNPMPRVDCPRLPLYTKGIKLDKADELLKYLKDKRVRQDNIIDIDANLEQK